MNKESDSTVKLKLGKKKYIVHYTFIPAKREGDQFPAKSVEPPGIEVKGISRRKKRLGAEETHSLATEYEVLIREEALKEEWNKRVEEIQRLLELRT